MKKRTQHLGISSKLYLLEVSDLLRLPDYEDAVQMSESLPKDDVQIFIRPDGPDALLRGRSRLLSIAAAEGDGATVPVRVIFKPSIAKWNLLPTLVRFLRNKYRYHGTGVYHISPQVVRDLGVERAIRTLDNPHRRKNENRAESMRRLEESLRSKGYDDARPIVIQICRTLGCKDSLRQGHHRISACLACGVTRLAVNFSAAGAWPREIGGNRP